MPYEELETLQNLVRELNEKMAAESDNYNALLVQCQDLLAKLAEQSEITNRYGQFFADIYRTFECDAKIEGEVNMPTPEAKVLYQTIDIIEFQASQTIDSDLVAKKQELDDLTQLIEAKKDELKQIQIDASYAANELQKDRKDLRTVQEDICYALRDQPSSPPSATPAPRKKSASQQSPEAIIENLPGVSPKKSSGQPSPQPPSDANTEKSIALSVSKPEPRPTITIETRSLNGFLVPKTICNGHLYLCAKTGAAPIDISDLVDVRLNHLLRLGSEFAKTYRPQFRIIHSSSGGWSIGEQQNVTNLLNGKKLQAEMILHNEDVLTVIDKDGKEHNLMFVFK